MEIRGKNIWITGATSGIGEALSYELAFRGARLGLTARREVELNRVAQNIKDIGAKVSICVADVTNQEELLHAVSIFNIDLGPLDIVIANAGNHIETWPENFKVDEYLELMNVNYGGMLRTFSSIIPQFQNKKSGILVGIASLAGYRGLPQAAAYGASKAAMIHFMESIRFHLVKQGIKVVTVNPGFVKTPLTDKNKFSMPFLLTVERSAQYIADGIESEKDIIVYPTLFGMFFNFMRIIPFKIYQYLVSIQWRRMQEK